MKRWLPLTVTANVLGGAIGPEPRYSSVHLAHAASTSGTPCITKGISASSSRNTSPRSSRKCTRGTIPAASPPAGTSRHDAFHDPSNSTSGRNRMLRCDIPSVTHSRAATGTGRDLSHSRSAAAAHEPQPIQPTATRDTGDTWSQP